MQFRGHSLPVHQSMSVSWAFTLSHFICQIRLRDFFRLLAIGMCHFLPVHHFGMAWYPTVWLSVLTELYNSSTSTQSPTQSLEWHVWSSSSGNNCHAVQRSLSSGASVYECIMGFYLVPFHLPNPPTRFLSITGHWNVSLPSGASLWNGMFARAEGQYITIVLYEGEIYIEEEILGNFRY